MGLYYFLLLFIGVALLVVGGTKKNSGKIFRIGILILGVLLIVLSIILLFPGSITDRIN